MCSHRTERKKKEIGIEVITYIAITPNPLPPIREKKPHKVVRLNLTGRPKVCVHFFPLSFFLSCLSTNHPSFEPNVKIRSRGQELNLCKCVYTPTHLYGIVFSDR